MKVAQVEKAEVSCHHCGYKWFPDATRWRNRHRSFKMKALHCPACNSIIYVGKEDLVAIVRRSVFLKRLKDFGKA